MDKETFKKLKTLMDMIERLERYSARLEHEGNFNHLEIKTMFPAWKSLLEERLKDLKNEFEEL